MGRCPVEEEGNSLTGLVIIVDTFLRHNEKGSLESQRVRSSSWAGRGSVVSEPLVSTRRASALHKRLFDDGTLSCCQDDQIGKGRARV